MDHSNRRGFFRLAATQAARGAREVVPLVDPLMSLAESPRSEDTPRLPPTARPRPTARSVSVEEMLEIAADLGLDSRADELRRLAVPSIRLTPTASASSRSFAGGEPEVRAGVMPGPNEDSTHFLALLDLPGRGWLWIFRTGEVDGTAKQMKVGVKAVLEATDAGAETEPEALPPGARSMSASPELTLPRPLSRAVAPLGLSPRERDSWRELRNRLAVAHGVVLGESLPRDAALHRLDGYPDESRGDMPLICELRALGVDLEGDPPASHPLADALEKHPSDWQLLAQLSADQDLAWSWGAPRQRLYVWGLRPDPGSSQYDDLQVVIQ